MHECTAPKHALVHIRILSSLKFLFASFSCILVELFILFELLNSKSSLYMLSTSPLSAVWFADIFSLHSLSFILLSQF